uniref:Uncharacterized protein n=1 Tax=Echinococcus canadensis TaxID=519352 RepID=A0A915F050_9CEST
MADSQSAFKFKKANIPGNQRICHVLPQSKLFMDGRTNKHCYPAAKITIKQVSLYPRGELWYLLKSGFTSPSWFRFKAYFIVKKEVSHILHCKNSLKYPRLRFKDKINGHLLQRQQLVILDSTVMTSQYTLLIFMTYTFSYVGYSDLIEPALQP